MAPDHPQATVRFAQFTDSHVGNPTEKPRRPDGSRALRRAVEAVGDDLDFVVHTGDIVSRPADTDLYVEYGSLIAGLHCPIRHIPGNHDSATLMAESLEGCAAVYPWSFIQGGVQFVGLDSSSGRIHDDQLSRLTGLLTHSQPVIVFVHHHICPMRDSWLNRFALENVEEFIRSLTVADHVLAIIHGHIHHDAVFEYAGVPVHSGPALTSQFDPYGKFLATTNEGPGFVEFAVSPEGVLSRHVRRFE